MVFGECAKRFGRRVGGKKGGEMGKGWF